MSLKPIAGPIEAQVLNDNFSYVRQLAEEAGVDPALEQKVDDLETNLDALIARIGNNSELKTTEKTKIILAINEVYNRQVSHEAESASSGVHGMGSAAAQDYEEGVFTPDLRFGGNNEGVEYGVQSGRYIRIGTLVHFELYIRLTSKGISQGVASVAGLPFVSSFGNPDRTISNLGFNYVSYPTNVLEAAFYISTGSSSGRIIGIRSGGSVSSFDETNFADNSDFRLSSTYRID